MRFLLCILLLFLSSAYSAENLKKVVFIAGEDSHGHGEHEFRAGCHLLAKALNKSGLGIRAHVVENGWPKDESILKGASAVIVYSNGREQHPLKKHFKSFDSLVETGTGVGFFHDAFNVEDEDAKYISKWIGAYYEKGFSTNPKWECRSKLNIEIPLTNGVKPFKVFDEWHFNIKFSDSDEVKTALRGIPDEAARSGATSSPRGPFQHIVDATGQEESLLWVKESKEGKRGFGFSGGHYHEIWKNRNVRTLVLNAIAWSAGVSVPKSGVRSANPNKLELSYRMSASPEEVMWSKELKNLKEFKLSYKSPVLKGSAETLSVDKEIVLKDAKELVLMVLDGGDGITKDHCGWLNPELIFDDGSTKPLTDLTWDVAITGWREIKINQGVESNKLLFSGKEVKGISTHALSIIRYKLPEGCSKFKVKMALLDSNMKRGSVQFEVYTK